jgi:zinc transport system ATP-binding protein
LLVSHDLNAISSHVKSIACLNRELHYHGEKEITPKMLQAAYGCPVELIAHGIPHRVLATHKGDE